MSIGRLVTSVTSKFGVVSRKASVRLATNTGKRLVDKSNALGRKLETSEIQAIFDETLPKRLRPKLLGTRDEIIPYLQKLGHKPEVARQIAYSPQMKGGCIPNGAGKAPIFIPYQEMPSAVHQAQTVAHELEHALERNGRIKMKIARKLSPLLLKLKTLTNKNFVKKMERMQKNSLGIQVNAQQEFQVFEGQYGASRACTPTREGLMKLNGLSEKRYLSSLRANLRKFFNGKKVQSENMVKEYVKIFDTEIPAYSVGGEIQRYALGLGKNQMATQEGVSILYRDAKKLLTQEKWLYRKNKLLGWLKAPDTYRSEKDIYRLVSSKEDKKLLKAMLKDVKDEGLRTELFYILKRNPNLTTEQFKTIKELLPVKLPDGSYKYPCLLGHINSPNFSTYKKLADIEINGEFPYRYMISEIDMLKNSEKILQDALHAQKNGKNICEDIGRQIEKMWMAEHNVQKASTACKPFA